MRILCCGSLNQDIVYRVPHIPEAGETIGATARELHWGGKGLNQAIALARSHDEVYFAGIVNASLADDVETLLKENRVHGDLVRRSGEPSGHAVIHVDDAGRNSITIFHGCNYAFTTEYADEVLSHFQAGDALVLQNEINLQEEIISRAADKGMVIYLNPSPYTEELHALPLDKINCFVINETEGRQMTGETEPDRIIAAMHARFPEASVLLTLGENGAVFGRGGGICHRQAAIPADVVDTTAAGDTFLGFFVSAVTKGKTEAEAMQTAAKAASVTISRRGAAPSIPLPEEIGG